MPLLMEGYFYICPTVKYRDKFDIMLPPLIKRIDSDLHYLALQNMLIVVQYRPFIAFFENLSMIFILGDHEAHCIIFS